MRSCIKRMVRRLGKVGPEAGVDVVHKIVGDVGSRHPSSKLQASFQYDSRELELVAASES